LSTTDWSNPDLAFLISFESGLRCRFSNILGWMRSCNLLTSHRSVRVVVWVSHLKNAIPHFTFAQHKGSIRHQMPSCPWMLDHSNQGHAEVLEVDPFILFNLKIILLHLLFYIRSGFTRCASWILDDIGTDALPWSFLVFQYVQCKLKDGSVTDPMKTFIDFTQP